VRAEGGRRQPLTAADGGADVGRGRLQEVVRIVVPFPARRRVPSRAGPETVFAAWGVRRGTTPPRGGQGAGARSRSGLTGSAEESVALTLLERAVRRIPRPDDVLSRPCP
jgi:hypothetical protein